MANKAVSLQLHVNYWKDKGKEVEKGAGKHWFAVSLLGTKALFSEEKC